MVGRVKWVKIFPVFLDICYVLVLFMQGVGRRKVVEEKRERKT